MAKTTKSIGKMEGKSYDLTQEFEDHRQQCYNCDFVAFLKKKDMDAELIEIHNVSY